MSDGVLLALLSVGLIALGFWATRSPRPNKDFQEIERVRAAHAYVSAVAAYLVSSMENQGRAQLAPDAEGVLAAMETSLGSVSITNDALVYQGASLPWNKVSHVDVLPFSFVVHTTLGAPITFGFTNHNLDFALALVTKANM